MDWIVDRIEGGYVVIEFEGQFYDIPIQVLPGVKEGDLIKLEIGDNTETRGRIKNKLFNLFDTRSEE